MRAKFAAWFIALGPALVTSSALAANDDERSLSADEIGRWLDRPSVEPTTDQPTPAPDEAPPAAPRRHGVLLEAGIGAVAHMGPLEHVTPVSPRFHLQLGYEPLSFLAVFAEADLAFSSTAYARNPPPPRSYELYGFGGGLRATAHFVRRFGGYLEASAGVARVSDDVLEVYGFRHSTEFSLYFGGQAGLEWYPTNPHLAVALHGGVRSYDQGLGQERSDQIALAVLSGLSLRYTF